MTDEHAKPFLDALDTRVLVCDGAMGTMLYARGVFLNRSFDELNLTQPDLVAEVHQAYVRAGADVIETNTFGANRIKLGDLRAGRPASHAINVQGAQHRASCGPGPGLRGRRDRPARDPHRAMGQDRGGRGAGVLPRAGARRCSKAASISSCSRPSATSTRSARRSGAVRSVCGLPIVAQVTTEEDGNTPRRRRRPSAFVPELERAGRQRHRPQLQRRPGGDARDDRADVRSGDACGCRRSRTPAGRARSKAATSISARRSTWRRTPDASSTAASAWSAAAAARRPSTSATSRWRCARWPPPSRRAPRFGRAGDGQAGRSRPADRPRRKVADGQRPGARERSSSASSWCRRAVSAPTPLVEQARQLRLHGVDLVNIPDGPRSGARMSALSAAVLVQQQAGIETVLHYACRDRNLLGHAVGPARRALDGRPQPAARHRRSRRRLATIRTPPRVSTSTRSA